jgi:hypothetical protein
MKATMMQQHIGFPEYLNDREKLDEEYSHVSNSFFSLFFLICD